MAYDGLSPQKIIEYLLAVGDYEELEYVQFNLELIQERFNFAIES